MRRFVSCACVLVGCSPCRRDRGPHEAQDALVAIADPSASTSASADPPLAKLTIARAEADRTEELGTATLLYPRIEGLGAAGAALYKEIVEDYEGRTSALAKENAAAFPDPSPTRRATTTFT